MGRNKFAGLALNKELFFLSKMLVETPTRPVAAIIGGAKISTKMGAIVNLVDKVDKVLVGGGMVFTFYRAIHLSAGDSIVEESMIRAAADLIRKVSTRALVFRFATDCVVVPTSYLKGKKSCQTPQELQHLKDQHMESKIVQHDQIPIGWTGLDIGNDTIHDFILELESCNTILWNGKHCLAALCIDPILAFYVPLMK